MLKFNNINISDYVSLEYAKEHGVSASKYSTVNNINNNQMPLNNWNKLLFDVDLAIDVFPSEKFISGQNVSSDIINNVREWLPTEIYQVMTYWFNNAAPFDYATLNSILTKNSNKNSFNIKLLDSHGSLHNCNWYAFENQIPQIAMQKWIDKNSVSKYDLLIIHACNEEETKPLFKGTPVFYPRGIVSNYEGKRILLDNQS